MRLLPGHRTPTRPSLGPVARTWLKAIPVVAAIAIVGAGAALGFGRSEPPIAPGAVTLTAGEPASASIAGDWKPVKPPAPTSYLVADATGSIVHLYEEPGVALASKPTMANPTWENLPVVFLVLEQRNEWLHVRVSSRPNNMTAWVSRSEVSLRSVPNRVLIEVGARRVSVFHGDQVLLQETVAVGTDRTPTPVGTFFVDGVVKVPYDTGPYGAYQVSVSGFSDALQSFGGGVGQIAMHGTNRPELLGQNVSNGCVRMTNENITKMVQLAPLGTPVTIVA
ncbi:MAG: ErfK/YbiS/YcfS/YnhG family protein [Ilumatobacteraceae bacterium]|nr:ErfK/YbiS/YcfS/YnhG family protein [Ilumatobacteraceae bacterium]